MENWLIWFIVGAILAVLEFITPGVIIIFIGIACWIVALLLKIGIEMSIGLQFFICAIISIICIVFLRKKIIWLRGKEEKLIEDDYIGKTAIVTEKINPNQQTGKIKLEGSYWPATANEIIEDGTLVRIINKESIILTVERVEKKN